MSPAVAKAEAATRGAKTDQSDAPATKKATGKDKADDALGLVRHAIPACPPNARLPLRNFALFSKQARAEARRMLFPREEPAGYPAAFARRDARARHPRRARHHERRVPNARPPVRRDARR